MSNMCDLLVPKEAAAVAQETKAGEREAIQSAMCCQYWDFFL